MRTIQFSRDIYDIMLPTDLPPEWTCHDYKQGHSPLVSAIPRLHAIVAADKL